MGYNRPTGVVVDLLEEMTTEWVQGPPFNQIEDRQMIQKDLDDWSDLDTPLDQIVTKNGPDKVTYPCMRCAGTGTATWGYANPQSGPCAVCQGRGYFLTSPDARRKSKISRVKTADKKKAGIAALADIWRDKNTVLYVWMRDNGHWCNFAQQMMDVVSQYGSLTENQYNAMKRIMDKSIATRKSKDEGRATIDLSGIQTLFNTAMSNGLKRPALVVGALRISIAPMNGNNAGCLYVKDGGEYAGKITAEGKFYGVRGHRAEIEAELITLAKDPADAAMKHGRLTGNCSCCARLLTKQISIDAGIGPICAQHWGMFTY